MKTKIKENINNPELLEKLYRDDQKSFEIAFLNIYPDIADSKMADFWKARLDAGKPIKPIVQNWKTDVLYLILACLISALLIKIPEVFDFNPDDYLFYEKNVGLIVLLGLSLFLFLSKKQLKFKHVLISAIVFIISTVFINLLPSDQNSDTIVLAWMHLPFLLWCLYGLIFIDFDLEDKAKRIDYIKHNGDLAILSAVILISGGILTAITLGLFKAIDLNIEEFYVNNILISGLVSVPIVATFILQKFPSLTSKIAPIIARIFSPLVLITLIIYLLSMVVTGQDPYNDRDFLFVFNLLLLGVMAIIVFSVSESSSFKNQSFNTLILLILSIFTLIVDIIAISAIIYRLGEFGYTPNRIAILGSNLLIFGNLVLIMIDVFKVRFKGSDIKKVDLTISRYLPIYALWTIFMVFILPFIFGLK